jgi:thiol-disulfide isomerase/thioredoxin
LSDYRGKWVIVNYWATWCPPCREEMPELESFHAAHAKDHAVVLGLNTEVIDKQRILDFLDENFISYPNFIVGPVAETPLGRIPGLPTTFVITPKGELVARQVGAVTREMIENFINKWEAKNP